MGKHCDNRIQTRYKDIPPFVNQQVRKSKKKVLQLNRHEAKEITAQLNGEIYWLTRGIPGQVINKNLIRKLSRLERFFNSLFDKGYMFTPEITTSGCLIKRSFCTQSASAYHDNKLLSDNSDWRRYNTESDASYFSVWININQMELLTYCEGDLSHVVAQNEIQFNNELIHTVKFYNPLELSYQGSCNNVYIHNYLALNNKR